jgi:hypothetical protein
LASFSQPPFFCYCNLTIFRYLPTKILFEFLVSPIPSTRPVYCNFLHFAVLARSGNQDKLITSFLYILTRLITQFSLGYLDKGSLDCCLPYTSNTSIRNILCSSGFCTHALTAILAQIPLEFWAEISFKSYGVKTT